jgi:hypothetical protein
LAIADTVRRCSICARYLRISKLSEWASTNGRHVQRIMPGHSSENRRGEPRSDSAHAALTALSVASPSPGARILRRLAIGCAGASLLSSLLLIVQDAVPVLTGFVSHAWLAASALLLAGTACIGMASAVRAHPKDVILRLSLGSAFILWGIQQLLHETRVSALLGDIVILLFVVDLGAIIEISLRTNSNGG